MFSRNLSIVLWSDVEGRIIRNFKPQICVQKPSILLKNERCSAMRIVYLILFAIFSNIAQASSPLLLYCFPLQEEHQDLWQDIIISAAPAEYKTSTSPISQPGILVTYLDATAQASYYQRKEFLSYEGDFSGMRRYSSQLTMPLQNRQIERIDLPKGRVEHLTYCDKHKDCLTYKCSQMRFIYPFTTSEKLH